MYNCHQSESGQIAKMYQMCQIPNQSMDGNIFTQPVTCSPLKLPTLPNIHGCAEKGTENKPGKFNDISVLAKFFRAPLISFQTCQTTPQANQLPRMHRYSHLLPILPYIHNANVPKTKTDSTPISLMVLLLRAIFQNPPRPIN